MANIEYADIIDLALREDLVNQDSTTDILIPSDKLGSASFKAKANGILAGTRVATIVFFRVDPTLKVSFSINDGSGITSGLILGKVEGSISSILKAERTALNFLQHLSGIATETHHYIEAVKGLPVKILDTRKTIPGLRILEKEAVLAGGGTNHRMNLGDAILIKDNHIKYLFEHGLTLSDIIIFIKQNNKNNLKIEVEVKNMEEAKSAVDAGVDIIMLDNMNPMDMQKAVKLINKRALVEASGNVSLNNVRQIAETGVDLISIGSLTHSSKALDINLKLD